MRLYGPDWYQTVQRFIEPSWPLLVGLAAVLVLGTLGLVLWGDPALLSLWLVYMFMP